MAFVFFVVRNAVNSLIPERNQDIKAFRMCPQLNEQLFELIGGDMLKNVFGDDNFGAIDSQVIEALSK